MTKHIWSYTVTVSLLLALLNRKSRNLTMEKIVLSLLFFCVISFNNKVEGSFLPSQDFDADDDYDDGRELIRRAAVSTQQAQNQANFPAFPGDDDDDNYQQQGWDSKTTQPSSSNLGNQKTSTSSDDDGWGWVFTTGKSSTGRGSGTTGKPNGNWGWSNQEAQTGSNSDREEVTIAPVETGKNYSGGSSETQSYVPWYRKVANFAKHSYNKVAEKLGKRSYRWTEK